ncbi:MAG: FGGY-family carbohydrate kinase [Anaerolineales bacterium]|nr:FGGY-family carbohydrate kinase [Anaerolineales bacterium]
MFLGIDVGTYSSKGVIVDAVGKVLLSSVVNHKMDIPRPGWAQQDADKVWWGDVVQICHQLLNKDPFSGDDIAAVAVSAIGPCMLPLDKNGLPLRPGILYGVDGRANQEIEWLNNKLGEETIFQFSKMSLSSQAVGPKILWMKKNEPDLWKKVDHITTASSYLIYRLTGEKVIDYHTACHFMPLIDADIFSWSDKFASEIVSLDMLPRLAWSDQIAGYINRKGAEQTGLKIGTPVAVGAVDALSEAISVGAVQPGDLMVMYGSTAFFILILNEPIPDKRLWSLAGAFRGQYCLAGGMATTGSITRWFRDEFAKDLSEDEAYQLLFSQMELIEPGAGGIILLPYFSGERTPINDPLARGVIAGLTLAHKREHVFRAILEGIAYGIRHNIETIRSMGADVKRIVGVGGGTKSRAWMQIVSDVAGVPQYLPLVTIGACLGDAFLAGLASGALKRDDLKEWVKKAGETQPNPTIFKIYDPLYKNYIKLYEQTKEIVHDLS